MLGLLTTLSEATGNGDFGMLKYHRFYSGFSGFPQKSDYKKITFSAVLITLKWDIPLARTTFVIR
jgi:hypothetical protein